MKKYIYKCSIIFLFIYLLYEATVGKEIRNFKSEIASKLNSFELAEEKIKYKEKIKELLKKDKIFYDEDAELLSAFIKKILTELKFK